MQAEMSGDIKLYLRLLRYVVPYWRIFLLSVISMIVLAATDPAIPALMKPMLDGAFIDKDPVLMVKVPILFVILFMVRGVAAYISGTAINWVANKVIMDLRYEMFIRSLSFPVQYYDTKSSGKFISKFTFDVTRIAEAATNSLTVLVRDALALIGLIAWMFYINWQLALISMLSAPFIGTVVLIIRKRLRKMSRKVQDSMGDINQVLNECIAGNKVIKLFGGRELESARFQEVINATRRYTMKYVMASVASGPAVQLITAITLAVIIFIATRQAAAGQLSVGEFVSFFGAMAMVLGPLKRLVGINEHIQKGLAASESVFGFLDEQHEMDRGTRELESVTGNIDFNNINFSYHGGDSSILHNIDLHIQAGETIALVGASGSGKTSLVNLLPGFYSIESGEILIDGINIHDISLTSLRENIALVSQDVVLFNDTIRNNIAYGNMRNFDEQKILAAAEDAYALEFIQKLPKGFDTRIGDDGIGLSGGQRQRIAIARALLKDASILILDEATSSLDTSSERYIHEGINVLKKGRTCFIIAHRLSTVENADRIIVLEQGKIVETGSHEELLKTGGVYSKLYQNKYFQIEEQVN